MSFKDALDILSNLSSIPRIDELKVIIYDLQKENLDLQSKLMETESKLKVYLDWEKEASLYKKHKTSYGTFLYVKIDETIVGVFYCPICFKDKSVVILQPITTHMNRNDLHLGSSHENYRYCPSCKNLYKMEKQ